MEDGKGGLHRLNPEPQALPVSLMISAVKVPGSKGSWTT
jgi:hypothetical protein